MMADLTVDYVLDKYGEIIKEEINVKDISPLWKDRKSVV